MKINKHLVVAALITTVSAGSIIGISAASAQTSEQKTERASKLAEKLGVETSAVESAFDEIKAENKVEREAQQAERLAGLVTNGTLTQEQADAMTAKKAEQKAAMQALKDSGATRDEIRTQMKESRDAFKAWAEEQGIDLDAIRPEKGEGSRHRGYGPHGPEDDSNSTDES